MTRKLWSTATSTVITRLLPLKNYISGAENETQRALSGRINGNIEMRSPSAAAMLTMVAAATIVRFPPVIGYWVSMRVFHTKRPFREKMWCKHTYILVPLCLILVRLAGPFPVLDWTQFKTWSHVCVKVGDNILIRYGFRVCMVTSSNAGSFRVTGHLCGEFTGPRWIPRTKASDAKIWCFLRSASEQTFE